jgi:putative Holliday junction resolvase
MGRTLGVDYGTRRVGFAVSDSMGIVATPLFTKDVLSEKQAVHAVCEVAAEKGAKQVVVGLPLNMDGTKGPMALQVEEFVRRLVAHSGLEVEVWDERMSTGLVERMLVSADVSRARRKEVRDKLAAQVILQGYLDAHSLTVEEDGDDED